MLALLSLNALLPPRCTLVAPAGPPDAPSYLHGNLLRVWPCPWLPSTPVSQAVPWYFPETEGWASKQSQTLNTPAFWVQVTSDKTSAPTHARSCPLWAGSLKDPPELAKALSLLLHPEHLVKHLHVAERPWMSASCSSRSAPGQVLSGVWVARWQVPKASCKESRPVPMSAAVSVPNMVSRAPSTHLSAVIGGGFPGQASPRKAAGTADRAPSHALFLRPFCRCHQGSNSDEVLGHSTQD